MEYREAVCNDLKHGTLPSNIPIPSFRFSKGRRRIYAGMNSIRPRIETRINAPQDSSSRNGIAHSHACQFSTQVSRSKCQQSIIPPYVRGHESFTGRSNDERLGLTVLTRPGAGNENPQVSRKQSSGIGIDQRMTTYPRLPLARHDERACMRPARSIVLSGWGNREPPYLLITCICAWQESTPHLDPSFFHDLCTWSITSFQESTRTIGQRPSHV